MSYGTQLVEADLCDLPTAMCEEIVTECPNVLCTWHNAAGFQSLEKFIVLAPRIENLMLGEGELKWLDFASDRERIEAALTSLTTSNLMEQPRLLTNFLAMQTGH